MSSGSTHQPGSRKHRDMYGSNADYKLEGTAKKGASLHARHDFLSMAAKGVIHRKQGSPG
jgi:hypothetical protein